MTAILIVDDDPAQRTVLSENTRRLGYTPMAAASGGEALAALSTDGPFAAVLLDLVMPDIDGQAVLSAMRERGIGVPVIAMTSAMAEDSVGSALSLGAVDYLTKPVSSMRLRSALSAALRVAAMSASLNQAILGQQGIVRFADFAATGDGMHRALAAGRKAARNALPVLIEGESGTGKTRLARAIHAASDRAARPFVVLDCASLSGPEIHARLFGSVEGSVLTAALGGSVLLKEAGELLTETQIILAHFLATGELPRDAHGRPQRANVRLLATSTRRLVNLTRAGLVIEPLFNRLNVMPIYMPPLRDRRGDIALLAREALAVAAAQTGRPALHLSQTALARLETLPWPGNVREMLLRLDRAAHLSTSVEIPADAFADPRVDTPHEPFHIDTAPLALRRKATEPARDRFVAGGGNVETLAAVERALIVFALEKHDGRMARVARALGIGRSTLYRKLKEYGLESSAEQAAA